MECELHVDIILSDCHNYPSADEYGCFLLEFT